MPAEDVRFLLVHHTAGQTDYSEEGAIDQMRSSYDFHTGPVKGWPDVAYNFFVDRFGRVFEGRAGSLDGPVQADATGGSQGFAQLVCVLGDFTSVMPSDAAISALANTLAWLADRYALETTPGATTDFVSRGSNRWPAGEVVRAATISGHRDMSVTACPGDTFYPFVRDRLPAIVHGLRSTPTSTSTTTTSSSSTTTSSLTTTPTSTTIQPTAASSAVVATAPDAATPTTPPGTASNELTVTSSSAVRTDEARSVAPPSTAATSEDDRSGSGIAPWLIAGAASAAGLGLAARHRNHRETTDRDDD